MDRYPSLSPPWPGPAGYGPSSHDNLRQCSRKKTGKPEDEAGEPMTALKAIYTEQPVKSLWNWLGALSSLETAKRVLRKHAPIPVIPEDAAEERARSLAFAIRSAREY